MHWIEQIISRVDATMTAIEKAEKLGTLDADDRSLQYPLLDQKLVHKAINECWTKVHQLEADNKRKAKEITELKKENAELSKRVGRYRIINTVLISIITGACWKGLEALIIWLR